MDSETKAESVGTDIPGKKVAGAILKGAKVRPAGEKEISQADEALLQDLLFGVKQSSNPTINFFINKVREIRINRDKLSGQLGSIDKQLRKLQMEREQMAIQVHMLNGSNNQYIFDLLELVAADSSKADPDA